MQRAARVAPSTSCGAVGRQQLQVSCVAAPPTPARTPASTGAVSPLPRHAACPCCSCCTAAAAPCWCGGSSFGPAGQSGRPLLCTRGVLPPVRCRRCSRLQLCYPLLGGPLPQPPLNRLLLQVKRAMTMTEKILAKHSDKPQVMPGDNVWTNVDKLLTHDVCGPGTFGIFQKEFGENAQVGLTWSLAGGAWWGQSARGAAGGKQAARQALPCARVASQAESGQAGKLAASLPPPHLPPSPCRPFHTPCSRCGTTSVL